MDRDDDSLLREMRELWMEIPSITKIATFGLSGAYITWFVQWLG